jgi:carboxymethylenebutenolidase
MRGDIGQTAAPVTTRRVRVPGTAEPMDAFVAQPPGWRRGPAVVVIQEWWGLTDDITSIATRLATDAGVLALAPDLYQGKQAAEPDDAQKLAMALDRSAALADLRAAVSWLEAAGAGTIGVIGFCMGAGLAWDAVLDDPRIVAAAPCYGLTDFEGRRSAARIEAHYGTRDRFPPELLEGVETTIRSWRPENAVHRYDGAPHAFLNAGHAAEAPEAAALAWSRIVGLFREALGSS